jgi:signal peptide peptidase SppA
MNEASTQKLIYVAVALIALTVGISIANMPSGKGTTDPASLFATPDESAPSCNVALIRLHGGLTTYYDSYYDPTDPNAYNPGTIVDSEYLVSEIENADASSSVEAIVLQVDSTGGSPVAAEEVANALRRADKPTVALIRAEGLSAAYWSATGADVIFAAENAEVGSIGVTSSYVDQSKRNSKDGFTFHSISTGVYKDMFNSNKELTKDEERLIREEIAVIFDNFVNTVSRNRGLAVASITPELTTGAPFTAPFALERGLIDRIGDKESVRGYLSEILKKPKQEVIYCR